MENKWTNRLVNLIWVLYATLIVAVMIGSKTFHEAFIWGLVLWWFGCYVLWVQINKQTQKRVGECLIGWRKSLDGWANSIEELKRFKLEIEELRKNKEPEPKSDTIMAKHGKRKIS